MKIKFDKFPDGQFHLGEIKIDYMDKPVCINTRIRNGDDLLKLYLLKNVLEKNLKKINYLNIYWLASARWDRDINGGSFDLRVFSNLINGLNCDKVKILDPHSYSTLCSIRNSVEDKFSWYDFFKYVMPENHSDFATLSPDAGASKKIEKFDIQCLKQRNGDKISIEVFKGESAKGKDVLVIDDICDGGGTFIEIAKEMEKYKPKTMNLMVTHGIFSNPHPLFEHYNKVYTTNSFQDFNKNILLKNNVRMNVFEVFEPEYDYGKSDLLSQYWIVD